MASNRVHSILVAARERIATPDRWTQWMVACNRQGESVSAKSRSAARWCAMGAIIASMDEDIERRDEAACAVRRIVGESLTCWNDAPERTHEEVLDAFDRAIASCGAEKLP